jgi:hypothetical protein
VVIPVAKNYHRLELADKKLPEPSFLVGEFAFSRETNWAPGALPINHRATKDARLTCGKDTMPAIATHYPDLVNLENAA